MNNADLETLDLSALAPAEVEAKAVWRNRHGHIIGRVGVLASIYYLDGHRREKRDGLMQIVNEFLALFRQKITHYQKEDSRQLTRWDKAGLPSAYTELSHKTARKTSFYLYFVEQTDVQNEDPELCSLMAFASDEKTPWRPLSTVHLHIPPTWFYENIERFVETIDRWCGFVQCQHGTAGLGVLSQSGIELQVEPSHYFLLKRYPGLEFDAVGTYRSQSCVAGKTFYRQPRSSNWLTMLGDENLAALGGPHVVEKRLGPEMEFHGYSGGALIRAGKQPQWGDAVKGPPEIYRAVAAIVKPIRFEEYKYGFMSVPDPLDHREESLKWLRRFD